MQKLGMQGHRATACEVIQTRHLARNDTAISCLYAFQQRN
jgi:hypothetical protein